MGRGGCAEQVRASLEASRHKKLEAPKGSWVESAVGPLAGPGLWPVEMALLHSIPVNSQFVFLANSSPHGWLYRQNMEADTLAF